MKKYIVSLAVLVLAIALILGGCPKPAPTTPTTPTTPATTTTPTTTEKSEIKVGFSISLSGIYSAAAESQLNPYQLWADQVNANGGIFVKDLNKTLPVRLIYYDDKSSADDCIRVYERLITTDKVDIILSPWGSTLHFALMPTVEKYGMPFVATTCGHSVTQLATTPKDYFWTWPPFEEDGGAVADLLNSIQPDVKTVAVIWVNDVSPTYFTKACRQLLSEYGFDEVLAKDYPIGVTDLSELLLSIKSLNPDALVIGGYPADTILAVKQMQDVGLYPKFVYSFIGPGIIGFEDIFGIQVIDGLCTDGPWHNSLSASAQEFYNDYYAKYGTRPDITDAPFAYLGTQIMQQAIENAGTLDSAALVDAIANGQFDTVFGPVTFNENRETSIVSGVLQWQSGVLQRVWPEDTASASLLFPKPAP